LIKEKNKAAAEKLNMQRLICLQIKKKGKNDEKK
jgi:hypothetical protein